MIKRGNIAGTVAASRPYVAAMLLEGRCPCQGPSRASAWRGASLEIRINPAKG
jgi:hypothetical protein